MTQIQDLFAYPIQRDISSVIRVDDLHPSVIEQELNEYIITDTVEELLIKFLRHYVKPPIDQTQHIGVWVSGLFGSGKSHFVKILSYVLENDEVDGRHAVEYIRQRITNSSRRAKLELLLQEVTRFVSTETIAFQIMTQEDLIYLDETIDGKVRMKSSCISTSLYRQWLKQQGFSTIVWIGRLEQQLSRSEHYEAFVAKVAEAEGAPWTELREHTFLVRDVIARTLCAVMPDRYPSQDRAYQAIDNIKTHLSMNPTILAKELAKWVDKQGRTLGGQTTRLVFIVDGMGQFIWGNNQRLFELRSIAEAFAVQGEGKLWLIVTAEEALEETIMRATQSKSEFDKLLQHFSLRIAMTSEQVEVVIAERILKKKESQRLELKQLYRAATGNLKSICVLLDVDGALPPLTEESFIAYYPFLPYQLLILQRLFVLMDNNSKERVWSTERRLISVVQDVLNSPSTHLAAKPLGRVVAFDEIYDQIQDAVPSSDHRIIDEVKVDTPEFAKRILKVLYLVQQLEWFPCTPANLARLLVQYVNNPEWPFSILLQQVEENLEALMSVFYVTNTGNQYEFISQTERDIELDIAAVDVTVNDRLRETSRFLRLVLDFSSLVYEGVRRFDVAVWGDDEIIYDKGGVTLRVYSPLYFTTTELTQNEVQQRSYGNQRTIYWIPAPTEKLSNEVDKFVKTNAVIERFNNQKDKSFEEKRVLRKRQEKLESLKHKIQIMLQQSLTNGTIVYRGELRHLAGSNSLNEIFIREVSAMIPHVYPQFEMGAVRVSKDSIGRVLTVKDVDLVNIEPNLHLFDIKGRINTRTPIIKEIAKQLHLQIQSDERCTGQILVNIFESTPYGWDPILVRVAVVAMFRAGMILLKYNDDIYRDYKAPGAQELLIKE